MVDHEKNLDERKVYERNLRAPGNRESRRSYDVPTAVTFLMAGVALGAILILLFPPFRLNGSVG